MQLGKKLVAALGEQKEDEISVWMANYIAGQMIATEKGASKEAKQKCFDAILQLWAHRSNFPHSIKPFVQINSIMAVIDSLNPDSEIPRYMVNHELENESLPEDIRQLLELVVGLDFSTRALVTYFLDMALKMATTEKDKMWFDAISAIKKSEEQTVFDEFDHIVYQRGSQDKEELLKDRITKLKTFENLSMALRSELESQLEQSN